jgi:hypothetical protein
MDTTTLSTLSRALSRLDGIATDARNFYTNDTGISFEFCRYVGYRGEYEPEWERISLTWSEFLDEEGSYPTLEVMCKIQWDAIRAERDRAEKLAKEEREKAAARERAREAELAPIRKRENELQELRKLMAAYPDEVNRTLFTNLPTTAP